MPKRPSPTSTAGAMIERVHRSIASQVKRLRMSQDRRQHNVDKAARVGNGRTDRLESGEHGADGCSLGLLCRVADALDCDVEVRLVPRSTTSQI